MNEHQINQLKLKVTLMKVMDIVLLSALVIAAIYTAFYAEDKQTLIFACLVGLLIVNALGRLTKKYIANMGVKMGILAREQKTEEQRTLMGTRHTTVRAKKTTTINTNPTTKT